MHSDIACLRHPHVPFSLSGFMALIVAAAVPASTVAQTYRWSTLAGTAGVVGCGDSPATDARFNRPQGIAVDGAGQVYVADAGNLTDRKSTRLNSSH